MPIPEPSIYRPSNLTKQQQQEQLAACYGVPMETTQLTADEIERMRQIVSRHDSERKPMQTIDLNNPPRQQYRFQKFPMMIYGSEPGQHITVHSESELQSALSDGWSEQPTTFTEVREEPLSAAYQAEVGQLQGRLEEARQRRRAKTNEAA